MVKISFTNTRLNRIFSEQQNKVDYFCFDRPAVNVMTIRFHSGAGATRVLTT
jgi:hypothetical protein